MPNATSHLKALMREYHPGTVLFEENDPGSRMYVIQQGKVRIFRRVGNTEILLAYLGSGDFFGEMALLERMPRSASAEVVETSMLIEVDAETFDEMIRNNHQIAKRIMRNLAARVRELDSRVQNLVIDSGLGRAVEVLRWLAQQGKKEGPLVRLHQAASLDLATQAGLPPNKSESILRKLTETGCIRVDGADLLIAEPSTLDAFASYLDLKRKYEGGTPNLPNEATGLGQDQRMHAMSRLLEALKLRPEDLQQRQVALAEQYRRYLTLRERFDQNMPVVSTPTTEDKPVL